MKSPWEIPFYYHSWAIHERHFSDGWLKEVYEKKGITIGRCLWLNARSRPYSQISVVYQILEYQGVRYLDIFWTDCDVASGPASPGMIAETWRMARDFFKLLGQDMPSEVWNNMFIDLNKM